MLPQIVYIQEFLKRDSPYEEATLEGTLDLQIHFHGKDLKLCDASRL